jgi:nucleotide-binding universal stress UspA family protein
MDIKHVVVPTDFSLPSRTAVNYGVALARKFRARLTLVHVLEPMADEHRPEDSRREKAIRELWELLSPEDQDDLDLHVEIRHGDDRKEIEKAIAELHADAVVLGTHGRNRLGRLVIGSTTEKLLRKLRVPILTISHATRPLGFKRLLFATDRSEASLGGFAVVLDLARKLQAEIVVLHTLDLAGPPTIEPETFPLFRETALEDARRDLGLLIAEGKRHDIKVRALLAEGRAAAHILKAAGENDVDLIVLPLEAKGAVERALLGTTAEHVVREAAVPVLSIPVKVAERVNV